MMRKIQLIILLFFVVCNSINSQSGDVEPPKLIMVSIQPLTGNVEVYWEKSPTPKVVDYVIYRNYFEIATVNDTTYWLDKNASDDYESLGYSLVAKRISDDTITFSPQTELDRPIFLQSSFDSCQSRVTLNWTPYIGWEEVQRYDVYYSTVRDEGYNIDTTLYCEISEVDTQYVMDVELNKDYYFYVAAVNADDETIHSASNLSHINTRMSQPPDSIFIDSVLSMPAGVQISASLSTHELSHFRLLRRPPGQQIYKDTMDQKPINPGAPVVRLEDTGIDPAQEEYFYRVEAVDYCGYPAGLSKNEANNIVLKAESNNYDVKLEWQPYQGWENNGIKGQQTYEIYRISDIKGKERVDVLTPGNLSYESDMEAKEVRRITSNGVLDYYIEARELNESENVQKIARSNTARVILKPEIYLPNAINPIHKDVVNQRFKPIISFVPRSFYMVIYDKEGKRLFETQDHTKGWGGTLPNGKQAPQGLYFYVIRLTTQEGHEIEKHGEITVYYR